MRSTTTNTVSAHRLTIKDINDRMAAAPKPVRMEHPCIGVYGPFRRGIIAMRTTKGNEKPWTLSQIARYLWDNYSVGPKSRDGKLNLNTAQCYLSTFLNNF